MVRRAELGPGRTKGEGGITIRGLSGRARVMLLGRLGCAFMLAFSIDSIEPEVAEEDVEREVVVDVESDEVWRVRLDWGNG